MCCLTPASRPSGPHSPPYQLHSEEEEDGQKEEREEREGEGEKEEWRGIGKRGGGGRIWRESLRLEGGRRRENIWRRKTNGEGIGRLFTLEVYHILAVFVFSLCSCRDTHPAFDYIPPSHL